MVDKIIDEKEKSYCLFYDEEEKGCIFNINFVCYKECYHRNCISKATKDLLFTVIVTQLKEFWKNEVWRK